jgi:sugar phosphate isomerase/epimerase
MSAHPRLSLNQATVKYADLPTALRVTCQAGITSIGLWREPVAEVGLAAATAMLADSGLRVSSLCRGGFFTAADDAGRRAALAENRMAIDETAALAAAGAPGSAPVLVLVAGGLPADDRDLPGARTRAVDAVGALVDDAVAAGVTLAIEPMHPIYAADRGVISTLGQALDVAEQFPATTVGVVIDTFHVWWDPQLAEQVGRAGAQGRIATYQVCDWITPFPPDSLLARGMMGEGHIDFPAVSKLVTDAGYTGDVEVEIFNQTIWDADPAEVAARTAKAFDAYVGL